ncbi:MAG: SDR family NAD(P)-dependent oxidoreductase [Nitrospiria bacterium]
MKDKIILITGAGRGIGRAAASIFAEAGDKVAICARSQGELNGVAREIASTGGAVRPFQVDIASRREIHRMVERVISEWGRVDVLINNAGVLGQKSTLATTAPESWEEVIRINLNGSFYVTQAVVRKMIPQRSGTILSLSSSVGRKGRATWGGYAVSKFGLEGMMQCLAEEVAEFDIRVITLNPEATRTKMRALAYPDEDPARLKDPLVVAKALLALARSSDPSLHGCSLNLSELKIDAC